MPQIMRLTKDVFIEKAKKVHGDKYDYSKVKYINNHTKVCIICPEHGEFWQTPHSHIDAGHGCPKCGIIGTINGLKKGDEYFIEKAKRIHGDKYDYSKAKNIRNHEKMCIICPRHGEFWQTAKNHLHGAGCPECYNERRGSSTAMGQEEFIKKAIEIHGDKYDYSKVQYVNRNTKVCIICPEHGEFWQTPASHIDGKHGCSKCSKQFMDKEYFVERARKIHGDKYDYSKVEYVNNNTKVCIICPEHGEFWQTPHNHLRGTGCHFCSKNFLDKDLFIEKAQKIYGEKYDYSKVEYINNHTKVRIICPEHGEFWQTPGSHLNGRGCPKCKMPYLERKMELFLKENNINYIWQYHNKEIFGRQSLDFYLPDYNVGIECQGVQHFMEVKYRSKKLTEADIRRMYKYCLERDRKKKEICENNGIKLISYFDAVFNDYIDNSEVGKYVNEPSDILSIISD